jgi:hypothetical protein
MRYTSIFSQTMKVKRVIVGIQLKERTYLRELWEGSYTSSGKIIQREEWQVMHIEKID